MKTSLLSKALGLAVVSVSLALTGCASAPAPDLTATSSYGLVEGDPLLTILADYARICQSSNPMVAAKAQLHNPLRYEKTDADGKQATVWPFYYGAPRVAEDGGTTTPAVEGVYLKITADACTYGAITNDQVVAVRDGNLPKGW